MQSVVFKKIILKFMNNSVFGKTMENLRNFNVLKCQID